MSKEKPVPSRPRSELVGVAKDIVGNLIFTDRHISPGAIGQSLGSIFMPLGLGCLDVIDKSTIGLIFARYDDAGPRSINGYPVFFNCSFLNKEDADFTMGLVKEMNESLDRFESKID